MKQTNQKNQKVGSELQNKNVGHTVFYKKIKQSKEI